MKDLTFCYGSNLISGSLETPTKIYFFHVSKKIFVKTFMKLDDWHVQANALSNFLEQENRKAVILALCQANEGTTDSNH
jgi:hypothetical protein